MKWSVNSAEHKVPWRCAPVRVCCIFTQLFSCAQCRLSPADREKDLHAIICMEEDISMCQHAHSASCTHAHQIALKKKRKEKKCKALISNTQTPRAVPVKLCLPEHSYTCRQAAVKVCSLTFTALHLQMQHVYIHFQTFKHHKVKCQSCRNGGWWFASSLEPTDSCSLVFRYRCMFITSASRRGKNVMPTIFSLHFSLFLNITLTGCKKKNPNMMTIGNCCLM